MAQTNVQAFSGDVDISSNLAVDTDTLFVDSVGDKVGIGTTDPSGTLDVNNYLIVRTDGIVRGRNSLRAESTADHSLSRYYPANGNFPDHTLSLLYQNTRSSGTGPGINFSGPYHATSEFMTTYGTIKCAAGGLLNGTNGHDANFRFYLNTLADTGTREVFTIMGNTGNVGIGTDDPDCALSVTGRRITSSPGAGIHMGMDGTDSTQYAMFQMNATDRVEIDFSTPDTDADGRISYNNIDGSMSFRTNGGNNRIFIKSDGNVGISTNNPEAPFEVHGANLTGEPAGTTGIISRHVAGLDGVLNIFGVAASNGEETVGLQTQIDGRAWQTDIDGGWSYGTDSRYDLSLQPYKGSVGIGTTNSVAKLHIYTTDSNHLAAPDGSNPLSHILLRNSKGSGTPYSMAIGVDQTTGIGYLNVAGESQTRPLCLNTRGSNVGIGTTNPGGKLHVYGAAGDDEMLRLQSGRGEAPSLKFSWSGGSAENFDMIDSDGGQRGFLFGRRYTTGTNQNTNAGWHLYGSTGALGVRINYDGLVGISQVTPLYTLDVTGTIRCGTNGRMLNSYVSVPYGAWANIPLGSSRGSFLILAAGTSNDQACAIFTACSNSNNNSGSITTQQNNNDYNRNSYIDRRYAANVGPQLIISGSQGYTRTCSVTTIRV